MYASRRLSEPVLTFLTQSPRHTKLAQNVLQSYFQVKNVALGDCDSNGDNDDESTHSHRVGKNWGDSLDEIFSPLPMQRTRWHSSLSLSACTCTSSSATSDAAEKSDVSAFFHFLSLEDDSTSNTSDERAGLTEGHVSLIAITDTDKLWRDTMTSNISSHTHIVQNTRDTIASHIRGSRSGGNLMWDAMKIFTLRQLGKEIKGGHVTGLQDGLPILRLPSVVNTDRSPHTRSTSTHHTHTPKASFSDGSLREIVLPFFDDATYPDGTTLLAALSKSPSLHKPMTGLYQWPPSSSSVNPTQVGGLVLRPLPVGAVDMFIPPPTLVFNCKSLEDPIQQCIMNNDDDDMSQSLSSESVPVSASLSSLHPVGRNSNSPGQLMVHQQHVKGLDLRFCQATKLSSSFAEAQDSLFAGSIADLQNVNVMVKGGNVNNGGNKEKKMMISTTNQNQDLLQQKQGKNDDNRNNNNQADSRVDAMNGLGDCWVEFRASMKNPRGYFTTGGKTIKTSWTNRSSNQDVNKVAKAPDLPYE